MELKYYGEPIWWINFISPFLYNPITSFERIKNQQGRFIHQGYFISNESVYDYSFVALQRIWTDKVIVIKNQKEIYKELDSIGINRSFIYNDFDSIAQYIVEKSRGT